MCRRIRQDCPPNHHPLAPPTPLPNPQRKRRPVSRSHRPHARPRRRPTAPPSSTLAPGGNPRAPPYAPINNLSPAQPLYRTPSVSAAPQPPAVQHTPPRAGGPKQSTRKTEHPAHPTPQSAYPPIAEGDTPDSRGSSKPAPQRERYPRHHSPSFINPARIAQSAGGASFFATCSLVEPQKVVPTPSSAVAHARTAPTPASRPRNHPTEPPALARAPNLPQSTAPSPRRRPTALPLPKAIHPIAGGRASRRSQASDTPGQPPAFRINPERRCTASRTAICRFDIFPLSFAKWETPMAVPGYQEFILPLFRLIAPGRASRLAGGKRITYANIVGSVGSDVPYDVHAKSDGR